MEFRTIVPIPKNSHEINYDSSIVLFGSCFAENMASKFDYFKFENLCNPFGIIFNAVSIEKIVHRIVNLEYFTEKDVFVIDNYWHCFEIHSMMSMADKDEYLESLNKKLEQTHLHIKNATDFMLSLGTSWVYELKESKIVVANCHKMPQSLFIKKLLTAEQNILSIENVIREITKINTNIRFTITISPVRHIKDGFFENNVSKSHLFSAVHHFIDNANITYFPSYEIIMDELRDYRFYGSDFLHPNEICMNYIWQKFKESQISEEINLAINNVESIQKMLSHKHKKNQNIDYEIFNNKIKFKIDKLQAMFPKIKF